MVDGQDTQEKRSYESTVQGLEVLGNLAVNLIKSLLDANSIRIHAIDFRVKEKMSASRKLKEKADRYTDYASLMDLLGIRIITYFDDEVDAVSRLIEKEFKVDPKNSTDKRKILESNEFGYLSVHYILELNEKRSTLVEYEKFAKTRFEVQVRSILQHAWAEIEHDIGYKAAKSLPNELSRRFSRLAGLLEIADSEFKALRDKSQVYSREVERKIERSPSGLRLNQRTIVTYSEKSSALRGLDKAIARALGAELDLNPSRGYIIRQGERLYKLGIREIDQLNKLLTERGEDIKRFAQIYARDLDEDRPDDFTVNIGISYLYLTYLLLSEMTPDLRTQKMQDFDLADPGGVNSAKLASAHKELAEKEQSKD